MRKKNRLVILCHLLLPIILLLMPSPSQAQGISGTWKGELNTRMFKQFSADGWGCVPSP